MEVLFEVFLPNGINHNPIGWNEVFIDWGGTSFHQQPAVYHWNNLLSFEKNDNAFCYSSLIGELIPLKDYSVYTLRGPSLSDFEVCANRGVDVNENNIYLFFDLFLRKIDRWVVLTLIDYDQFDQVYYIENVSSAIDILKKSLDWDNPKGIALIKS
ncbi:hypothetical protein JHU04_001101 [Brenneria sp. 4F2]|nr:hypothetical protein [Brenneria bubanii]